MTYKEYIFGTRNSQQREILLALLEDLPFDTFKEEDEQLKAYGTQEKVNERDVDQLIYQHDFLHDVTYQVREIPQQNWNEQWEQSFEPVVVDNQCMVRASFHPQPKEIPYDIIVNPKMSFGTGHHETTYLMIRQLMQMNLNDKHLLDMGTGTGVLAILAAKMGAVVEGIDIDEWSIKNARENFELNDLKVPQLLLGDVNLLKNKEFDVILANINRNILLDHILHYQRSLRQHGTLVMSGFYLQDIPVIDHTAKQYGFEQISVMEKNQWVAVSYQKN